ncbi:erythromycin esterase family protein [Planosporangium mesophilum]|uniref:Protein-L-isoaspartate O-methyltransferase n=1 Tax=Planosporangium mesophilum TaxID=689768 RepID=A0A8J3WZP1_9ACTN|nr:erythromycin esterase family protein [Planosporangium mesophilum]NJC85635.1 erythromycin esterase family protein [Planosporangium mesophilum]GII21469.1 hypothetical protein Pme01_10660 [Planosporangium mesophilum]
MGRYGDEIRQLAAPLNDAADFDPLLDRIDGARIVMLGEASHGTHEFYQWRALLTRRLIEERGFSFVGVEGDWPDCDRVDRAVRCRGDAPDDPYEALEAFERWPTWMWANEEVVEFCRWLRDRNVGLEPGQRAGFHGLDVYSLWESMRELILHLREHDPARVAMAIEAYRCFEPFGEDPQRYAMATRFVPMSCEDDVVKLLRAAREHASTGGGGEEFTVRQNAEVVAGAERYYRAMVAGGANSWNVRDQHMMDTLDRLLAHYGPASKAVVWAHNTHVGDARATDMTRAGMFNLGQLGRERYGRDNVVLVGFGTHRGTVMAGSEWGAPMEVMRVPTARPGSLEDALHADAPPRAQFVFPPAGGDRPGLLTDWLDHRAIGVVYRPDREHWGNYVPTKLGDRYDAFCWFEQSRAVRPLHVYRVSTEEPETYPVGV